MATTMKCRQLRECTTPAEVLEECLLDIRDGLWVCNVLTETNYNKPVAKPMGCAVGLIGINSRNCIINIERGEDHSSYNAVFNFESVFKWDDLGQRTSVILANALAEMNPDRYEQTYDHKEAEDRIIQYNDSGNYNDYEPGWDLCEGCKTVCNGCRGDGDNLTSQQANEWFQKALEIANR